MPFKNVIIFGKKIINLIHYFIKSEKVFRAPKKAKILVIDSARLEVLIPLFNGEPFEVLFLRRESINVNFLIITNCLKYIIHEKTLILAYAMAFIDHVNPSIVITFIDNNSLFHQLDARNNDEKIKFIAIQNGNRIFNGRAELISLMSNDPKSIYHSNFFCFGEYEVDEYKKHGAYVKNFYPCGSLIDSYYRSAPYDNRFEDSDICLVVNNWSRHSYSTPWGHQKKDYELLLTYLGKFLQRNGKIITATSVSLPDSESHRYENEWLQKYLGTDVCCVPKNDKDWTSYLLTDRANVVVGFASTLIKESFGRGKKILECNYSGDPTMELPVEGIWSLKEKGYEIFEERLLELLSMDSDSYNEHCMEYRSYLIGYDESKPTHTFITEFIDDHINLMHN